MKKNKLKNSIFNCRFTMIKREKGISLYLTIIITTLLLSIVLAISRILLDQIKLTKEMGDSIIAFYAADTGIERALKNISMSDFSNICNQNGEPDCILDNGAKYYVSITLSGVSDCTAGSYCIKSTGIFRGTRRAIEVSY